MEMGIEHFRLFFIFLLVGLVDLGWESPNFSNAPNTKKEIKLYPKMVPRLGKHLLRAKSKPENFELFAIYPYHFLSVAWLLHG